MPFTPRQQQRYRRLLNEAFEAHCERTGLNADADGLFDTWKREALFELTGETTSSALNHVDDYDVVCMHLATIAGNEADISYFAEAAERRCRRRIKLMMDLLSGLEARAVDWAYVRTIADHMHLPDLADCPALLMRKVIAALDPHIRRLLRRLREANHAA
jgi:hypothetical protein